MKIDIQWKEVQTNDEAGNEVKELLSEDGDISITKDPSGWKMIDQIDSIEEVFATKDEALFAGAKQIMISKMGNFNAFLDKIEKSGKLNFCHKINSVDGK